MTSIPAATMDEDFVQQAVTEFAAKFKTEAEQVVHAVAKTARDYANARHSLMDQRDNLQDENVRLKTELSLLQQATREVTEAEVGDALVRYRFSWVHKGQSYDQWRSFELGHPQRRLAIDMTITANDDARELLTRFIILPRPVVSLVEGN